MFGEFDTLDLQQRTDEWLRWRAGGVGASESGCLLGRDPFKTEGDLTHAKLSLTLQGLQTPTMHRGAAMEPEALKAYIDRTGRHAHPACIQSRTHPWMRASVDGLNRESETAVEIKCGLSTHKYVYRNRSVPETAYMQMQHILAITGYEKMDFWCYETGRPPVLITLRPNDHFIGRLVKAVEEFWRFVGPTVERKLGALD